MSEQTTTPMLLNDAARRLTADLESHAARLKVARFPGADREGTLGDSWDFGIHVPGGIEAGLLMASVCLAGLGRVTIEPAGGIGPWPLVQVYTDHPVTACMASQYAGWKVAVAGFFGMASGPLRAAAAREPLFGEFPAWKESPAAVVGVIETGQIPTADVVDLVSQQCGISRDKLTLLFAPTRSLAGSLQVVARSVETALHQLHIRGADLSCVVSAHGSAPLPPVAARDIQGIGRTNDAILYGGRVTLWMRAEDDELEQLAAQIHSGASSDHGQPFERVFERYDHDFYQVDPHLFAPAVVCLINLNSGRSFIGGEICHDVLQQSFGGAQVPAAPPPAAPSPDNVA